MTTGNNVNIIPEDFGERVGKLQDELRSALLDDLKETIVSRLTFFEKIAHSHS